MKRHPFNFRLVDLAKSAWKAQNRHRIGLNCSADESHNFAVCMADFEARNNRVRISDLQIRFADQLCLFADHFKG